MSEPSWSDSIKKKRRKQTFLAVIGVCAFMALFFAISALGFWVWVAVFHNNPPGYLFLTCFYGLGSLLIAIFGKYVPLAPLKGTDPEILAADEFFKGPQR